MRKTVLLAFIFIATLSFGQVSKKDSLFSEILKLDKLIFEVGFNSCNFSSFDDLIAEDLEFYHDKGGVTKGKTDFINSLKNGICKSEYKPNRELDYPSFNVYPLENKGLLYGAIAEGIHYFSELQNGKRERGGKAQFSILWIKENSQWKMKRVLSYNHKAIQ